MKKISFLLAILPMFLFTACSSDDDTQPTEAEILLYAYSKYSPDSYEKLTYATFFFFDASHGEQFKEETINIPNGDYFEYTRGNCEMTTLLENNEFELVNGTRVKPILIGIGSHKDYSATVIPDISNPEEWSKISNNKIKVPFGKYYVVVLSKQWGSGYAYGDKYSGKYLEVSADMPISDKRLEITIPHDVERKGYIGWVSTNWKYLN